MKIDFKEVYVDNIEGQKERVSIDYKNMANVMYTNARDLEGVEMAREIFHKGEVELTKDNAKLLRDFLDTYFVSYILKVVFFDKIDKFLATINDDAK